MRKLISLFSIAATMAVSTPAFAANYGFRTVLGQDALHQEVIGRTVTARVVDGSIEPEVRRVHTNRLTGEFHVISYDANMWFLEALHCATARRLVGLPSSDCFHFSKK